MNNLTIQWGNNSAVPTELDLGDIGAFEMDDKNWKALDNIVQRLNAYEKTGLEPNEIHNWISVKEKLPKDNNDVLVDAISNITGERIIELTAYCEMTVGGQPIGNKGWAEPFPYFLKDYTITHWKPLPHHVENSTTK